MSNTTACCASKSHPNHTLCICEIIHRYWKNIRIIRNTEKPDYSNIRIIRRKNIRIPMYMCNEERWVLHSCNHYAEDITKDWAIIYQLRTRLRA